MAALFESLAVTGSRKADGSANASGRAWFYRPGTQTKATVYGDAAQSAPISNPVTLNAGGKATVYFAGQVDVFLETSSGLPISTLTLAERAERVEVQNAGFTGLLPSGSQGAGGATDLNTVLSSIAASVGGLDGKYKEYTGATSRNIADKFREVFISTKDYGAVGDGIADDTSAVQRAANEASRVSGILYFPPGTYLTSSAITFNSANVAIRGAGQTLSTLKITTTVSGLLSLSGTTTLFIEDLGLTCSGNSVGTALQATPTSLAIVSRVKISNFTFGIIVSGTGRVIIKDCDITTVAGASARAIQLACSGVVVSGNNLSAPSGQCIELTAGGGIVIGPGNQLSGVGLNANNTGTNLSNVLVLGNQGGTITVTGADAIIRQFGNGIDGPVTDSTLLSGGTFTPDRTLGNTFAVSGNTTGSAYTIAAPTPAPRIDAVGIELTLILKNNSGGAITGWTMNAVYHTGGAISTTNGDRTTIRFRWEQTSSIWREVSRAVTT